MEDKKKGSSGSKQTPSSSTLNGHRCFKCHELRHIAFDSPNTRVIAFVEDENYIEEKETVGDQEWKKMDVAYTNQGMAIVVQHNLKASYIVDDENWVRKNVFHTKCTFHSKMCMVIIDSGSFENVVSLEIV